MVAYLRICFIFVRVGGNTLTPLARDTPRMHLPQLSVRRTCVCFFVRCLERTCNNHGTNIRFRDMSRTKRHARHAQRNFERDAPRQTTIFLFMVRRGCVFRCQTGGVAYVRIFCFFFLGVRYVRIYGARKIRKRRRLGNICKNMGPISKNINILTMVFF